MCLKKPFAVIEWNIDQVPLPERCASRCILIFTMDRHAWHSKTVVKSADRNQDNNHVFFLVYALVKSSWFYYEEYRKAIEDPDSSIVFRIVIQQYPYVLLTLVVAEEAGVMQLKPGTPHFTKCDLTKCTGTEEAINIAPKIIKPSPEWIKEVCDKLLNPQDLEGFNDYRAQAMLPKFFKMVRVFIKLSASRPTNMNFFVFFGIRGVHEIAERFLPPFPNPPISETEPLDPSKYSPSFINRLLGPEFQTLISNAIKHASKTPNPLRNITHRDVLNTTKRSFKIIEEPTVTANAAATSTDAPQRAAPQQVAPQQMAPAQQAVHHDAPQQEATTEHPQSVIPKNESGHDDEMDEQGAEDFELQLFDDTAPNMEQWPGDTPNPAAAQGTISEHPNQVKNQASDDDNAVADTADTADNSIAEISCSTVARGRKRSANEAQVRRKSSHVRPTRQATTDENFVFRGKNLRATSGRNANVQSLQVRGDNDEYRPETGVQGVAGIGSRGNANAYSEDERHMRLLERMSKIQEILLMRRANAAGRNGDANS